MPNEGTEDVVIVQGPIHYADYRDSTNPTKDGSSLTVVVTLARTQNGLVMMSEAHEVDTIALGVVCVHLPI